MDESTITTKWTNVAPMTTERQYAASVAIDKHRFLVLGGNDGDNKSNILSSIELFDRQERKGKGKWERLSCDMPKRLHSAAVARVGDKVYLIGGSTSSWYKIGFSISNKIYALDISKSSPSEWTWEEKRLPSMKEKRSGCAAVANGEFIYVIGGQDEDDDVLDSVERYDIDTRQWENIESMPTERTDCAAVLVENKIYVIGGYHEDLSDEYTAGLETVEVFDLKNQTWESTSTVTNMLTLRDEPAAVAIGRYIVVTGGKDSNDNPFSSVEVLDTSSGNWTRINSMRKGRAGHTAVVLNESDVYVTGGWSEGTFAVCEQISLPTLNAITSNRRHKKTPAKKVPKQERILPNAITSNHRHKKTPSKKVTKQKNVLPIDTKQKNVLPIVTKQERILLPYVTKQKNVVPNVTKQERILPNVTKQERILPNDTEIFISARFRGDVDSTEAEARSLHRELLNLGMKAFMVDAKAGDNFGTHTRNALYQMKTMVAFCSSEYGAKTTNRYCSYFELQSAYETKKQIVAVRRCKEWPPKPLDHDGGVDGKANNALVFTQGIAYLPWHEKNGMLWNVLKK